MSQLLIKFKPRPNRLIVFINFYFQPRPVRLIVYFQVRLDNNNKQLGMTYLISRNMQNIFKEFYYFQVENRVFEVLFLGQSLIHSNIFFQKLKNKHV